MDTSTKTIISNNIIKEDNLFVDSKLNYKIVLKPIELKHPIKNVLTNKLKKLIENKCIEYGYVLPDSIVLDELNYPIIERGNIIYHLNYTCKLCYPVEGMILECICDIISRGGIHAKYEYINEKNEIINPIEIYILREHNLENPIFNRVKEKDKIKVCVIGTRIEINNPKIYVIAKLVE